MPETCAQFEAALAAGAANDGAWDAHRRGCEGCREQWEVHEGLRALLGSVPVPSVGARFDQALAAQTARGVAPSAGAAGAGSKAAAAACWTAALAASFLVAFSVSGPGWPPGLGAALLFATAVPASFLAAVAPDARRLFRRRALPA